MIEICRARNSQRRTYTLGHLAMIALLIIGFALQGQLALAAVLIVIDAGIVFLIPLAFIYRENQAEARRRATGAPPSWPARVPVPCFRIAGGVTRLKDSSAVQGRLELQANGWKFVVSPRIARASSSTSELEWARSAPTVAEPMWGLYSQGVLTFRLPTGELAVEVRHAEAVAAFARVRQVS
jgi:hypothetical protein